MGPRSVDTDLGGAALRPGGEAVEEVSVAGGDFDAVDAAIVAVGVDAAVAALAGGPEVVEGGSLFDDAVIVGAIAEVVAAIGLGAEFFGSHISILFPGRFATGTQDGGGETEDEQCEKSGPFHGRTPASRMRGQP